MWSNLFTDKPLQLKAPDLGLLRIYGLIRIAVAYCLLHLITFGHVLFAPLWYPKSYWTPVSIAFLLGGAPEPWQVQWISILGITFTVLLLLGAWTRYTGALAFVFAGMMSIISFSYGRLNHNTNTVLLLLLVFSFSDWGHCFSLDALWRRLTSQKQMLFKTTFPEWPIQISLAVCALPYFTTALFKILKRNFLEPGYIAALIKHKQILWDIHGQIPEGVRALQNFMMANPVLGDVLVYLTLGIELFFFMVLFSKESRVFMLAAALILHSSITLTTKIYFLEHMLVLGILLTASLVLLLRERDGFWQRFFPQQELAKPVGVDEEPASTRTPWVKSVIMYAFGFGVLMAVTALPQLPMIPMKQWLTLRQLHEQYPIFPTNTYLFGYTSDVWIGLVGWVYSFLVLSAFMLRFLQKAFYVGILGKSLSERVTERILIYDGDCGFCQNWCNWAIMHDADHRVRFQPAQRSTAKMQELGLELEDARKASIYVERYQGKTVRLEMGAGAINAVLCQMPGPANTVYRLLGLVYFIDGIKQLQNLGYAWIAQNRHRLAPGACSIDSANASVVS